MKNKEGSNKPIKIRGGKELANEVRKDNCDETRFIAENPIKRQIKINQFPWTEKQKDFFRVALHPHTKIIFVSGPAGTSKTLLATYCALQLLNLKSTEEIMYLRSAVESSDKSLGYLPGNADEKLKFFNLPFLDKLVELLAEGRAEKLEQENRISMFPVNFARGMNWKAKCVILDEAQNSTEKEIMTVLTRLGEGSRAFILADPMQTDLKGHEKHGGYSNLANIFSDEDSLQHGIYHFTFDENDIMRSELVKFLIKKINEAKRGL
jgi:phosphate starvation-inducible PhoH-like protein